VEAVLVPLALFSIEEFAMTQAALDRQVARATSESVKTIALMGFVPLTPVPYEREPDHEPDREPLVVDWDEVEANRQVLHPAY
jgi:hypothetical protein